MSQTLYLECYSGISGDMFTAALLDLGADENILKEALNSLSLNGYKVEIKRVSKSGLDACDFSVCLDKEHENHDHDMEYLHGHEEKHEHKHSHTHDHSHDNTHDHSHEHSHDNTHDHHHTHDSAHTHEHRNLSDIMTIIESADLTPGAKKLAVRIFEILAVAEAKAHGVPADQVHFHEVGAVDSIVDIVAAAVCIDNLGIQKVIVPTLHEGKGFVRCQHGMIPVPVPAVSAIVQAHGLTLSIEDMEGEFVTPTGAAIVAAIRTNEKLPKEFTIEKVGIGAGKRNYERPSILRAMLIAKKEQEQDCIYKLESNIDDCTGEVLGYVMQRLLDEGARDVHYTPVYMKKNRPAYQLNVICTKEEIEKLEDIIFTETTTIGIRRQKMERSILKRELKEIHTSIGTAKVKICTLSTGRRVYPEYDSVAALGRKSGLPWQEVYQLIVRECDGAI